MIDDDLIDFNPTNLDSWRSPDLRMPHMSLCHRSSIGYRGWMAIPLEGAKGSISLPKWRLGRMGLWWGVVRSQDSYVVPRARMIEPRCGTLISTLNRLWEKYIVIIRYFVYFFVCFMCFCLCSHSTMHICMHVCFFHTHTRTRTLHTHIYIYVFTCVPLPGWHLLEIPGVPCRSAVLFRSMFLQTANMQYWYCVCLHERKTRVISFWTLTILKHVLNIFPQFTIHRFEP